MGWPRVETRKSLNIMTDAYTNTLTFKKIYNSGQEISFQSIDPLGGCFL